MRGRVFLTTAVLAVTVGAVLPTGAGAARITVSVTADEFGSGTSCSLREAVQAANGDANFGGCTRAGTGTEDTIRLEAGETYGRTLGGAEDLNASGDLDITGPTKVKVVGTGKATLDANDLDRVLEVHTAGSFEASRIVITDGTAQVPHATNSGGGINSLGRLKLTNSVISDNAITSNQQCTCGGGLANLGRAKLHRVLVTLNRSTINFGGGIAAIGGRLTITGSTIDQNVGGNGAGIGIILGDDEKATIARTTISNNQAVLDAGDNGGGIYSSSSFGTPTVKISNVTISGNQVTGSGGGVFVFSGTLALNAATITDNVADVDAVGGQSGGGISGSVAARNSIIAGNTAQSNPDNADCLNNGTLKRNLVGKNTGCFAGPGSKATLAPMLGPLAANGGPTLTHKLRGKSPAIGLAGKGAPPKDQRGRRRDSNPDAGSYER